MDKLIAKGSQTITLAAIGKGIYIKKIFVKPAFAVKIRHAVPSGSGSKSQSRRARRALRHYNDADNDADPEKAFRTEKRVKEDFHPRGRHKSRHDDLVSSTRMSPGATLAFTEVFIFLTMP